MPPPDARPGIFPPTRRSAVLEAGSDDPAARARAFEALVQAYFLPAYKHTRLRWRRDPGEAEEIIQDFFARAFEKGFFARYDPAQARFRTFFKTCLDRHVIEGARRQGRDKRGGGLARLSLDVEGAEAELARAGVTSGLDPEAAFDREWARGVLSFAVQALRDECASKGREKVFAVFERYVLDEPPGGRPTYDELARELGVKVTDVNNFLAAARRDFRRHVLSRLRALTGSEEEFEAEARALLGTSP